MGSKLSAPHGIIAAINDLEEQNITFDKQLADLQNDVAAKNRLKNQYASDHSYLTACYQSVEKLKYGKSKIPWHKFSKRRRVSRDIKAYRARILLQLDEIKKYDGTIVGFSSPEAQCRYLSERINGIDLEISTYNHDVQSITCAKQNNNLLIDTYTRELKQYQIDTYNISVGSLSNMEEILPSCSATLVSLMRQADGERLDSLRKHYYDFIVNSDEYDGLYPYHLQNMQYPQDLIDAVRQIDASNDCYDERFQMENTTMLCKMVISGAALEEILEHKNDVAYIYEEHALKRCAKHEKQKNDEMER